MANTHERRSALAIGVTVFLVVGAAAAFLALRDADLWEAFIEDYRSNWDVRPAWLVLALAAGTAALSVSAATWGAFARSTGGLGKMGVISAAAAWMGSNLGRYLPGKVWQLAGLAAYVRARGDSGALALTTVLSFQALSLATGAAIALLTLGGIAFSSYGWLPLAGAAVLVGAAVSPALMHRVLGLARRIMREASSQSAEVPRYRPSSLFLVALGSAGAWMLHGLGFWLLLLGIVPGLGVSLATATGLYAAAYIAGYLVLIAPAGVVAREGALTGLLSLISSIALGSAAVLAFAARLWATAAEMCAFASLALAARLTRGRPAPVPNSRPIA